MFAAQEWRNEFRYPARSKTWTWWNLPVIFPFLQQEDRLRKETLQKLETVTHKTFCLKQDEDEGQHPRLCSDLHIHTMTYMCPFHMRIHTYTHMIAFSLKSYNTHIQTTLWYMPAIKLSSMVEDLAQSGKSLVTSMCEVLSAIYSTVKTVCIL